MAEISSYPLAAPKGGDLILFTETYDIFATNPVIGNPTKTMTVSSLVNLIPSIVPGGGTVTLVTGTGAVSGLTLTGSVSTTGSLTLGGALSLTQEDIWDGLGFKPYPENNPNNFTDNYGVVTTLTANGTSGPSTLIAGVLNVPSYATAPNGVTSIIAGDGVAIDTSTGDVTVSLPDTAPRYMKPIVITLIEDDVIDLTDAWYDLAYLIQLFWSGVDGIATINLPTAAVGINRVYRFVTQRDFTQSTVNITPSGAELIDGNNTSYAITADFAAIEIWSDGTEWFIIQEKA
jgi:hypothetical protein